VHIRFDDETLVFGEAQEGDEVLAEFIFTNIGRDTVEIDLVSACDCIRAEWPREPIFPGESALISTIFDTKGWAGERHKTIDIIFKNTDSSGYPWVKQVALDGTVEPK
jgi:hypothetical protein